MYLNFLLTSPHVNKDLRLLGVLVPSNQVEITKLKSLVEISKSKLVLQLLKKIFFITPNAKLADLKGHGLSWAVLG